jgi:hypothetical protein
VLGCSRDTGKLPQGGNGGAGGDDVLVLSGYRRIIDLWDDVLWSSTSGLALSLGVESALRLLLRRKPGLVSQLLVYFWFWKVMC